DVHTFEQRTGDRAPMSLRSDRPRRGVDLVSDRKQERAVGSAFLAGSDVILEPQPFGIQQPWGIAMEITADLATAHSSPPNRPGSLRTMRNSRRRAQKMRDFVAARVAFISAATSAMGRSSTTNSTKAIRLSASSASRHLASPAPTCAF